MEYKKLWKATLAIYSLLKEVEKIYINHGDFENPEVRKAAFKGVQIVVKNWDDIKYEVDTLYSLHSYFLSTAKPRIKNIQSSFNVPNLGKYGGCWSYSDGYVILDHHEEKYCIMTFFNNSTNTITSYLGDYFDDDDTFVCHGINRRDEETIIHVIPMNNNFLYLDFWKIEEFGELHNNGWGSLTKAKL